MNSILIHQLNAEPRKIMSIYSHFKGIPIIQQFVESNGIAFFQKLVTFMKYHICQPQEILIESNKPVNSLFFFINGNLSQQLKKQKYEQSVQQLTAIEDIAFLTRQSSKYSYIALEDTLICYVSKDDFYKVIHPKKVAISLINELLKFPSFVDYTISFLESITQKCTIVTYFKNQIVYNTNEEPYNWYIIRQGEFQFMYHNDKYQPLMTMQMGDYFGEVEILQKCNRFYRVVCTTNESQLFEINKTAFLALFNKNNQFQQMIVENARSKQCQYDIFEKTSRKMLQLPFPIKEKQKLQLRQHVHLQKHSQDNEVSVEQLKTERKKEFHSLMQYRIQLMKLEEDKTNSDRLRERNPRLQQFLQKLQLHQKLSLSKHRKQKTVTNSEMPTILRQKFNGSVASLHTQSITLYSPTNSRRYFN